MRRRSKITHMWVLFFYTVLVLLLSWPLVRQFTSHMPGDGIDDPALAWNLWWIKARLVDQLNWDIFHTGWMFFPVRINLGFYTLTPLNGLLSVPLQTAFSLVVANNLLLLSSFVLGGYGTFLLVRYLLVQRNQMGVTAGLLPPTVISAIAAGIIYAFASSKFFYASLGQFNIASSQWIPFAVLYTMRMGRCLRRRDALLAALFLTLQAWAELTYASFLLIFLALYFVWQLVVGDQPGDGEPSSALRWSLIPPFVITGFVFLVGLFPFLWAMLPDMVREGDFFASGGGFADVFSADLLGYFVPTRLHPLLGTWVAGLAFPNDKGQHIFVGYSALTLAVLGTLWLIRRRGWRGAFWPLATFFFWWLTLGPVVRWNGQETSLPGPFALVSRLPFFSGNRYPSRYSVMLMLGVAVLAGHGLLWLLRRVGGGERRAGALSNAGLARKGRSLWAWRLGGALILVFLLEHLSAPLPLNDFRVPAIYTRIAAEPGDFTLLELPTGWRNGARVLGKSDVLIMMQQWYQTVHGKRRLGGNTSRNPAYKFQYFTRAPLIGDLIALMNADRPHLAPVLADRWDELVRRDRPIAPAVLDFLNVRFITLQMDKAPAQLVRFVEEVLPVTLVDEWSGPNWAGEPSTIRLYRVDERSDGHWTVELGATEGRLNLAEGWVTLGIDGHIRYATRDKADLLLDLPRSGGRLTLHCYGPAPLARLSLNGQPLTWTIVDDLGTESPYRIVAVQVPPGLAERPVDRLTLSFDGPLMAAVETLAPADGSPWAIGETGYSLPADRPVLVRSAGEEVGDFAHIFVAGVDVARNERGYNLVALDEAGNVLESVVFDTDGSAQESAAMAAWLARWPAGTIVAGAVGDDASFNLGQEAVTELARLGVAGDLRDRFRWSHAFVGVVGAAAGSAVEALDLLDPATAVVGLPLDAAFISGGVGRIQFEPADRLDR